MNEFVSKKHDGRKVVLLLLAILSPFLATLIVHKFSLVSDLELLVYDWHCASLPRLKPDPRIVLIGMDDESLQAMNQPSYPLPRSLHGQLINELNSAGASSILFDIMFTNADTELEVEDRQFVAALRGRRNVIVSTQPKFRIDKEGHEQVTFALPDFRIRPFVLPAFIVVQKTFGNSVRSFKPSEVDADEGMRFNHLATMIAAAASHSLKSEPLVRNTFHMGSIDAPLGNDNEVMIRYIGPPETFQPIPYSRILQKKWTYITERISSKEKWF